MILVTSITGMLGSFVRELQFRDQQVRVLNPNKRRVKRVPMSPWGFRRVWIVCVQRCRE